MAFVVIGYAVVVGVRVERIRADVEGFCAAVGAGNDHRPAFEFDVIGEAVFVAVDQLIAVRAGADKSGRIRIYLDFFCRWCNGIASNVVGINHNDAVFSIDLGTGF